MSSKFILITYILSIYFEFLSSQSAFSVASDNALCTCNFNHKSCDINCCCDVDCSVENKYQFSTCLKEDFVNNDQVCSYAITTYNNVTREPINTMKYSRSGFCTYTNNYDSNLFYSIRNPILNMNDLNNDISAFSVQKTTDNLSPSAKNINHINTSLFPLGFTLSGNIGYINGKPVMRGIRNNQNIIISLSPTLWWALKSGDNCDQSTTTEPVLFGVNMMTGCSILTNIPCNLLQAKANTFLESEMNLNKYLIGSFANMNLINGTVTNINDWVNIKTISNSPTDPVCPFITTRKYDILYSRIGSTLYPHNKIVGIRAQSIYNNTNSQTAYLKTIVNFIDVSQPSVQAAKLSPFMTVMLPYDFFYPIYTR